MLRLVASYVVMVALLWGTMYYVEGIGNYVELVRSGMATDGYVLQADCGDHGAFSYRYVVGNRQHSSRGNSGMLEIRCDELQPNQNIRVVYLPSDPSISVGGDPKAQLWEEGVFAALFSLFVPGAILWGWTSRKKERWPRRPFGEHS